MPVDNIGNVDDDDLDNYVPVVYGMSIGKAEWYCQLLEDHDIPARVDEDYDGPTPDNGLGVPAGVPVLVPEPMLEEAKEVIAEVDEVEVFAEGEDEDDLEDDDELETGFITDPVDHEEEP